MLSRHFLRSKVLQEVYARRIDEERPESPRREFDRHISRLNELAIIQTAMLPRLVQVASVMVEEGKRKFRPSPEEANPNTKMLDNEFVHRMADNYDLKKYMQQWAGCLDTREELLREAYLDLRTQSFYRDYLANPVQDFETDKEFAIMLFRYLFNREAMRDMVGERSLLWEDDFDQIGQYVYMHLKTLQADTFDAAMMWPLVYDTRIEKDNDDMEFAHLLLSQTVAERDEAETLIRSHLQGWDFERVAQMDIILITMAIAELTSCSSIPERVTVDEYIELSKEFSSDRSKLFINGIMDKLMIELRSKGRINKSGRGLFAGTEEGGDQ